MKDSCETCKYQSPVCTGTVCGKGCMNVYSSVFNKITTPGFWCNLFEKK